MTVVKCCEDHCRFNVNGICCSETIEISPYSNTDTGENALICNNQEDT